VRPLLSRPSLLQTAGSRARAARRFSASAFGGRTGLSLLEITVSVVILAIAILGSVQFVYEGRAGLDEEEWKRTATEIASRLLEERRVLSYPQTGVAADTTITVDNKSYRTVITAQTGVPISTLTRVVATTTWPSHVTGRSRSLTLSTYLANHP
jgi:Tfp pilus assembly protein PilV